MIRHFVSWFDLGVGYIFFLHFVFYEDVCQEWLYRMCVTQSLPPTLHISERIAGDSVEVYLTQK